MFARTLTLMVLLAAAHWPVWARPFPQSQPPQTDQSLRVARGARLTVENHTGEVRVSGWDRDIVRVQARHTPRIRIAVRTVPAGVSVSASAPHGPASIGYEIHVPRWMPIKITGHFVQVAIEGTSSEIAAETVRGDVVIAGGAAFVSGKSIEGDVRVAGARGRINVSSINQGVTVHDSSGDIVADTVNGPIRLTNIGEGSVDASTVNGHVSYEGAAAPRGKYRFVSHNGNIAVAVPDGAGATFVVRTYNGTLNTNLPLAGGGDVGRGRRAQYALGNGSAEFELESFGGTIHIRRQGSPARSKPPEQ